MFSMFPSYFTYLCPIRETSPLTSPSIQIILNHTQLHEFAVKGRQNDSAVLETRTDSCQLSADVCTGAMAHTHPHYHTKGQQRFLFFKSRFQKVVMAMNGHRIKVFPHSDGSLSGVFYFVLDRVLIQPWLSQILNTLPCFVFLMNFIHLFLFCFTLLEAVLLCSLGWPLPLPHECQDCRCVP